MGDNKINGYGINDNEKIAKKSEKSKNQNLFKSRNLKSEILFKSLKLAKLEKKLSKSRNLSNFGIIKIEPKFLTLDTRIAFNCL